MRSTVRCWSITWATSCGRGWRPSMANGFIDKTWQNHFWNLRGLIQSQCQTRCPPECRASENLQVDNLQMSFLPSHRRNCKLKYLSDKPTALVRRRPRNFAYNASERSSEDTGRNDLGSVPSLLVLRNLPYCRKMQKVLATVLFWPPSKDKIGINHIKLS